MKVLLLIYYLIIQKTIIQASNQYLGCFIDQVGNRDLSIFIGDYEQLTPKQCILACREQNFLYAAIQYGSECRCGQQYGKYGKVSEDECDYLCSTAEKCGGDYRNSVYNVLNSIDIFHTDVTCRNNLIGYQGCFDSITLTIGMNIVNSIEQCIKRCAVIYNYAGVMNGNLCYCGNHLNLPSINSNLCNIQCHKNLNCCGGLNVLSIYNIKNYQSSLLKDLPKKIIRVKRIDAANDSNYTSSYATDVSSIATSLNDSTSLSIAVDSSLMMSSATSATPIVSTDTAEILIETSYLSTSTTPTLTDTSTLVTIIPISTNSISVSQSSTNPRTTTMSSAESGSMYSVITDTDTPSSFSTYASEAITDTATAVLISSVTFASQSFSQIDTSQETSVGTASLLDTTSSQTSSHTDTILSTNPTSNTIILNILSDILTSVHTDTTQSVTSSQITEFNSNSVSQSTNPINTEISLTSTMTSAYISSQLVSTASTYLSETSTVSISLNSISSSNITFDNSSSFSTMMPTESPSISSIISTPSSQVTATISQQSNSESSIPNTLFLSTNSLASNSTNIGIQTTITSSFYTAIPEQTTITTSNISSTIVTTQTVNSTVSTSQTTATTVATQAVNSTVSTSETTPTTVTTQTVNSTVFISQTTATTVPISYVISTIIIVPSNQNFTPNDDTTRESIRIRLSEIITLAFQCLNDPSNSNCIQPKQRIKRQACSTGYDVNLISPITEISTSTPSSDFMIEYTVSNPCDQGALVSPVQVRTATDKLSPAQISLILGYQYVGDFIRSTSIGPVTNPTSDPKLWLIGAILGPIAFVLLLIFAFCYLHYKCRPRPTNRTLTKIMSNVPIASPRAMNYQTVSNGSVKEQPRPPPEKNLYVLTQNDPLVSARTSSRQLTPVQSEKISNHISEYPMSNEIPMDEIRRQNDVERWRNKLRLQEKFQKSSIALQEPSVPSTNRSNPYHYDNRAFEFDPSHINIQPANEIISTRSPRPISQTSEIEAGRTKLHRLLDQVLDKADSDEVYNPDSDIERQKRRRQRRRIYSISNDQETIPSNQQIPHIPVIPQVSDRPDPSLVRLRYNPYEAGDRAHDISRLTPVELKPKYVTDDQRYIEYSSRSNPPLFYDDSTIADRAATATDAYANPKRLAKTRLENDREAAMRHDGGRIDQRKHKFNDDAVYIDSISKNRDGYRVQARTAWVEPEIDNDLFSKNDYLTARRSAANTRNIISSIHDELQHITVPSSDDYHA